MNQPQPKPYVIVILKIALWINTIAVTFLLTCFIDDCFSFIPRPQRTSFNFWIYSVLLSIPYLLLNTITAAVCLSKIRNRLMLCFLLFNLAALLLLFPIGQNYDLVYVWSFLRLFYFGFHILVCNRLSENIRRGKKTVLLTALCGVLLYVLFLFLFLFGPDKDNLFLLVSLPVFTLIWSLVSCFTGRRQ